MKALYFDGHLDMKDIPEPEPGKGEALVRVTMAGICRTDIEIACGYMRFTGVPGHEFVGIVEEAGEEKFVGKRVVGEINIPHGECEMCARGLERHCYDREVLGIAGRNGAFAEKLCLPEKNLLVVPESIEDQRAVFTEPVAACYEIIEQLPGIAGKRVLIVGDGRLAFLAAQVMKDAGCDVVLVGKYEDKLWLIRDEIGIEAVASEDLKSESFEVVVECSGCPSGLKLASSRVKPRGTIVMKSTYGDKPALDLSLWVVNEITILGSRCGPFEPAMKAISEGRVDPVPLIDNTYSFDNTLEAFKAARKPGAKKILIRM